MKAIKFEIRDRVAWLTIDGDEGLNTFNPDFAKEFCEASLVCAGNKDVRAVVITGAGNRFFSAGANLKLWNARGDQVYRIVFEMTTLLHPAIARFAQMDAPVIAAVNGMAVGGALCIIAGCDLAIAARSAKFMIAYPNLGQTPDLGGTFFLPRILGARRALELMLLRPTLDAEKALEWGIVNKVVDDADLHSEVEKLATELSKGPSRAFGAIKRLVYSGLNSMEAQMELEARTLTEVISTADSREGLAAFIEKRQPVFSSGRKG
jgi:2-(1,2-epoxy-1,2-dihydrophenyl)acetyl-CoA isomerase